MSEDVMMLTKAVRRLADVLEMLARKPSSDAAALYVASFAGTWDRKREKFGVDPEYTWKEIRDECLRRLGLKDSRTDEAEENRIAELYQKVHDERYGKRRFYLYRRTEAGNQLVVLPREEMEKMVFQYQSTNHSSSFLDFAQAYELYDPNRTYAHPDRPEEHFADHLVRPEGT